MKFEIELQKIGRQKVSKTISINAIDLEDAEYFAERECRKYLLSSEVSLHPTGQMGKNWGIYGVYAGIRKVGEVKIRRIE